MAEDAPLKLNLGAGDSKLEGYIPIDRKFGQEVYPLDQFEDGTVDEIYASHVLEHFSHRETFTVVCHWVSKLKPGGRMRVAVPNFEWIARNYLDGEPINVQGYTMGGHVDGDDHHGAIFDYESMSELLSKAGLQRIRKWVAQDEDCSALPVSLNVEGFKPLNDAVKCEGVMACMSTPRFGPMMHMRDCMIAIGKAGVPYQMGQGAYWHQVLTQMIEKMLKDGAKYIMTIDYDTLFRHEDIVELYRIMETYPDFDAACPMQMKRGHDFALFGMVDKDGKPRKYVRAHELDRDITQIFTGHFGLTMIRASAFEKMKKPWFMPAPNKDGEWNDGRIDADIAFWHNFRDSGLRVGVANKVIVGHLENVVKWPSVDCQTVWQDLNDYGANGMPAEVMR